MGDTPELAAAALTLGVAHPPGYPLLTLLGHVFGSIMPGSLPFRVNLVAVTCSAATVVLVYLTAVRLTREDADMGEPFQKERRQIEERLLQERRDALFRHPSPGARSV